jgi:hypothetical protein
MTPILGIMASQISGHLETGAYESIATETVGGGGSSSITFSSIPSTYTHLQVRCVTRSSGAAANSVLTFNGDTGNNYASHWLTGNGSAASSGSSTSRASMYIDILGANASGAMWSADVVDILDYTNTNKNKTIRVLAGQDFNGSGTIWLASGLMDEYFCHKFNYYHRWFC